jgi:hypothetical protein
VINLPVRLNVIYREAVRRAAWVALATSLAFPLAAHAQDTGDTEFEAEGRVEYEDEDEPRDATTSELLQRLEALELRLDQQEQSRRAAGPALRLSGYADLGAFVTEGDGSGTRRDVGNAIFPEESGFGWVFYGDLLAPTVNSRGEVADLGDLPGTQRFDSLNTNGAFTFLVNELNLTLNAGLSDSALFTASVNFMPRTGKDFALGDFIDVDLAQLEWLPTSDQSVSVFVGKVESVIGIEYKQRKANLRFGITPTLIARYTTGSAIGLKARVKLFGERIILAAAATNGSFGTEQFHFYSELDTNDAKTGSGRAAIRLPIFGGTAEVGVSGSVGKQDGVLANTGNQMWFFGVDAEVLFAHFELRAQWLRGWAPGSRTTESYSLDLDLGGYVEAVARIGGTFGVLARGELRDARVWQDTERLYLTKSWRAVVGVRLTLGPHVVAKLEALHNGEYGGVPSIPNSVVTSSLVISY